MNGTDLITATRLRLAEAQADLAAAKFEDLRGRIGEMTRCVFVILPQGWGWLPVTELEPLARVDGEWVPNVCLMPSQPGGRTEDGQDGDALPPFGALADRGMRQIPTDLLKDLLLAQVPVGAHVVDDAGLGVPSHVADRR